MPETSKPSRPPGGYHPGDPTKTAEAELPVIIRHVTTAVKVGDLVTATMISHLFDLVPDEAKKAVEGLIAAGILERNPDFGNIPIRCVTKKKQS